MLFEGGIFGFSKQAGLTILVLALSLGFTPALIHGATHQVALGASIQDAVNNAGAMDIIELEAGTHTLTLGGGTTIEIKNKNLTIRGLGGPGAATVDGDGLRVFHVEQSTVVMENLVVTGGDTDTDEKGAGIYQNMGKLALSNCVIRDNGSDEVSSGGGIAVSAGELIINGCTITGNEAQGAPGVFVNDGKLTIIDSNISENVSYIIEAPANPEDLEWDCLFSEDFAYDMGGGVGAYFSEVSISHTTIEGNVGPSAGGLALRNSIIDLSDSFITNNLGYCEGGGLWLHASEGNIKATEITLNTALAPYWFGGGGGGLYSIVSNLDITGTLVSGNEATRGGGLYIDQSVVFVSDSTISGNKADKTITDGYRDINCGGGMAIIYSASVTVSDSTISGNSANDGGGGIWVDDYMSGGYSLAKDRPVSHASQNGADLELDQPRSVSSSTLRMNNSTVSGNIAGTSDYDGTGGGLQIGGKAYINFSTITDNAVTGESADQGGGVYAEGMSRLYLGSTIVAGNTAASGPDWYTEGSDSRLSSFGGNLIGNNTDSMIGEGDPNSDGDYVGTAATPIDPRLGPLADNGGPTRTHALLTTPETSPALDAAVGCTDRDQRGYGRPYPEDGACDIGAFEHHGRADLNLAKEVDNGSPLVGDRITYTLSITNSGPDQASGVSVTDLLPSGVTYVSDDGGGDYDPDTGIWAVGFLSLSQTKDLNIQVRVDQTGNITNTASAGGSTTDDSPAQDDAVIVAVERQGVTLTLTKAVNNDTPTVGDSIQYTLTVANTGDTPAETVRVMDLLPRGLNYQGHSSAENYDPVSGVWTVGDLAAGGSRSLEITSDVTLAGTITNTAAALSSTTGSNSPTAGVDITAAGEPSIDLELTKTALPAAPLVDGQVVYTLRIENNGPHQAEGVRVSDLLPTGLTYLSHAGPGAYNAVSGLWTVGNLNGDEYRELEITAQVDLPGTITNTATAFSSTAGAGSPTARADITATKEQTVDLDLTKTVVPNTVSVGEQVVYTLTIDNNGPDGGENVVVSDLLPTGLTHVSDDGSGRYDPTTGLWDVGDLDAGGRRELNITAQVDLPGTITNTATAFSTTVGANSPTAGVDITATEDKTVVLALDKAVNQPTPLVGDQVVYTLEITNNGPDQAENVVVSDLLPTGLSHVSDTGGTNYDPVTGLWIVGDLDAATGSRLEITAQVTLPGTITNTATAFCRTADANSPTTGVDIFVTEEIVVDLALSAAVNSDTPLVGDQVVFSLKIENYGPHEAENVQVSDLLPTGLSHVSDNGSGSYVPATGLWTVGNLGASESRELEITAQVTHSGTISNTAVAFSTSPGSNSPSARVDIVATQVCDVALTLAKTVDMNQPRVGDRVTYSLTIENRGADPAAGVVVSDLLPTGLNYISHTAGCDYSPATGAWVVGDLPAAGSAGLEILAEVILPGTITNSATAFSTSTGSRCTNASVDILGVLPPEHALVLINTVNDGTPVVGGQVVFTLFVAYLGSEPGEGVLVTDLLPAGLEYVSDDGGESYDPVNGEWTIGAMNQYDARQLHITAGVTQPGTIINTATVVSSTPGVSPADASVSMLAAEEVIETLGLMKSVDNLTPRLGNQVTYTIVVTNEGQDMIEAVNVYEPLPEGLTYISDDSGGDFNDETGLWGVGDLDVGVMRHLNIVVEVSRAGLITNTAIAVSEDNSAINASSSAFVWGREEGVKGGGSGGGGCFVTTLE